MTDSASASRPEAPRLEAHRPEARSPRGFADKRATQIAIERRLIETVSKTYEALGFEIRRPMLVTFVKRSAEEV